MAAVPGCGAVATAPQAAAPAGGETPPAAPVPRNASCCRRGRSNVHLCPDAEQVARLGRRAAFAPTPPDGHSTSNSLKHPCRGQSTSLDGLCSEFREKGATASQVRPFQCAHVLVFRAFTVSVYMFLRQFCKRHWQSTSELVGLRRQVGAESVRSMHVHNFLSNSRASTSGLFVSRCVTHTIACVQVVSVVFCLLGRISLCVFMKRPERCRYMIPRHCRKPHSQSTSETQAVPFHRC